MNSRSRSAANTAGEQWSSRLRVVDPTATFRSFRPNVLLTDESVSLQHVTLTGGRAVPSAKRRNSRDRRMTRIDDLIREQEARFLDRTPRSQSMWREACPPGPGGGPSRWART